MQMEMLECGAACLAMILAYYEKWIPLEQVRSDCGVSRDGSNAKNLLLAARNYGLDAKGYRFEPASLRQSGTFPCIIHWNFNHFVVLRGFKGDKALLNDPAKGNYSVSMKVFDESFTGICLMFSPNDKFEKSGARRSMLGFAKSRLIGAKTAIIFVVMTTAMASIITLITTAFSGFYIDRLLSGSNPEWFLPFIIVVSSIGIIQLCVNTVNAVYSLGINGKLSVIGTTSFLWHVLRLPMEFFSQRMAGDIDERKSSNAEIANTLIATLAPLVLDAVMMVFYLVVMIRYSLSLTLIGVLSVVINLVVSNVISQKRINITRVQMRDAGKLAGATVSGIEMIETIKASGAENGFFEKWSGHQAGVNTAQIRYEKLNRYLGMIPVLVTRLANIAVLIVGVYLTMVEQFTPGMVMVFQGFLMSFTEPAMTLISSGQTLLEMRSEMERVEDVMNYPVDRNFDEESSEEYAKLTGNIEMKNVTFSYSKLSDPLIKDFNLSVRAGDRIAFVGESGCGKSTLSKLISGLYKPLKGEILFDGRPIDDIDNSVFTGSLSVVDQDIILFEDTISNNIKMWDSTIEDFEMIMAARDSSLHEDIMKRDGGYQYRVGEGGKDFSGGERQRMEIARVLAQDPTIIILDEATSALDAKTEQEVIQCIKDRGITCIVIAHRLSTIRDCDEIVVMSYGEVVERGTHEELYAKGGAYSELVSNE